MRFYIVLQLFTVFRIVIAKRLCRIAFEKQIFVKRKFNSLCLWVRFAKTRARCLPSRAKVALSLRGSPTPYAA